MFDTDRFQDLFQKAPVAHCVVGRDGHVIVANDEALSLFGYPRSEFEGLDVLTLHAPSARHHAEHLFQRFLGGEAIIEEEVEMQRADGETFHALLFVRPVHGPDGSVTENHCTVLDISARKRAQQEVRDREEFLRTVLNRVPGAVYLTSLEGHIEEVNDVAVTLTGFTEDELEGTSLTELLAIPDWTPGQDVPSSEEEDVTLSGTHRRKDGSSFPADLRIGRVSMGGVEHFLVLTLDVTRRHELQQRLLRTHKLRTVGTLAGGVAHEFNNLLAVIMGSAEFLAEAPGAAEAERLLEEIRDHVRQGQGITKELLTFSREGGPPTSTVDVNEVVMELATFLGWLTRREVEVVEELQNGLPPVSMSRSGLEEVLLHLALNAQDAIVGAGSIVLRTRVAEEEPWPGVGNGWSQPARWVLLSVTDTGSGMSDETSQQVFDPFFTTKDPGRGRGLGLAIVHGIVDEAGGDIRVTSTPGGGTTVEILLPPVEEVSPARR